MEIFEFGVSNILYCGGKAIIGAVSKSDMSKRIVIMVTCFVCTITFVSWGTAYTTQLDPALKKVMRYQQAELLGLIMNIMWLEQMLTG